MRYVLPTPVAGQTHALVNYIEIRPGQSIEMAGTLGTVEKDAFVPLEGFSGLNFRRTLTGAELEAFTAECEKQGVSMAGLMAVLAGWLDTTGLEKSRYAEIVAAQAAEAEAAQAATEATEVAP